MRSRWNLPIYIAYVLLCLVVLAVIVKQIGVTAPWQSQRLVTAVFHSGDGILPNNDVYLNGVRVGRVKEVDAVNGKAVVTMLIADGDAGPIFKDASADVRKKNLLGETYIDLHRGGQGTRQPLDGTITTTLSPVDIDEVLAILDPQTRDRVKLLINGAGDALKNQGPNLNEQAGTFRQLTTELNGPAQVLAARQDQVSTIVVELQRLYTVLANQRDQVRDEMGTWAQVMGQLANQEQSIRGTLQQADTLLQNTDTLLTGTVPAIQQSLANLPQTLTSTQRFLGQSTDIFNGVAPYRNQIHAVFNDLQTTFADTDPTSPLDPITGDHQHFWSVYSVSCHQDCSGSGTSTSSPAGAPNAVWASAMGLG